MKIMNEMLEEVETNFLPEKLVAVDCEFSGVVPERDDLIQIAMVKLELDGNQYVEVGEPLVLYPHSDKKPEGEFHTKYLTKQYEMANKSDLTADEAKKQISEWLGDWKGVVQPFGDCVNSDMAFLYAKGMIDRNDIVNDKQVPGTFHYEQFDQNSVKAIARTKLGKKEDKEALDLDPNIHDALVDCRNQTKELNYYIGVLLD